MVPLYVAKFLWNLVFWYSIEKLFMVSIGFNNESIAFMVAVYAAMSVLMEVPSGVLADRWSRKGVLALGALCLAISSLVGGLSYAIPLYLVSAIFWGFFDALNSGTDSAIVYDTLVEERGDSKDYEKEYGIYQSIGGVALFVAGFLGGVFGDLFTLRGDYFFTVPATLAACLIMMKFHDSRAHHEAQDTHLRKHLVDTFGAVFKNPNLLWIMLTMFAVSLTNGLLGEMYQLWYIAVAAPVLFFGIAGSIVNATWGFGGLLTRFLTTKRAILLSLSIILFTCFALVFTRNLILILGAQFVLMMLANATHAAMTGQMHRQLPSHVRAGAGSAANTAMRLVNIPLVLLFGWVAHTYSIFAASWILVTLVAIAIFSEFNSRFRTSKSTMLPNSSIGNTKI